MFGATCILPFVIREGLKSIGIFETSVTLDVIAGIVFIFLLLSCLIFCKDLLRNSSIHIITDDVFIIGKNLGLGKTERYSIKELRRKESEETKLFIT